MRLATLAVASLLFTGAAAAQVISPLQGSSGTPAAPTNATQSAAPAAPAGATRPHQARQTFAQRFEAANTTHDGHLTLAQAQAGHMPSVVRDFATIDKDKHGYVTMEDVKAYRAARRAAHRAAPAAK
ncbi:MAG: hypothetical protein NVSMB18_03260 [Acetobacteraceae bacterium]